MYSELAIGFDRRVELGRSRSTTTAIGTAFALGFTTEEALSIWRAGYSSQLSRQLFFA